MPNKNTYNLKRIIGNVLWSLLGMGAVVLLGAAISKKNNKFCKGINITIKGVQNNFFIDEKEVKNIIENINNGKFEGRTTANINLSQFENVLQTNPWIKKAELFFDNNEVLQVDITEREPVARIFNNNGTSSFYIDTSLMQLPLSDKFSARVPLFTSFPLINKVLTKTDSALLSDIKNVSSYILKDPFWMAQIDQIDIMPDRSFEMVPKVGNQTIVFGTAENYQQKFENLLIFYKQVLSKVGWNKYSKINAQFKGQIVCVKRGAQDVIEDSLRAKQIMQAILLNSQKLSSDSTGNIQLVQASDDNAIPIALPTEDSIGQTNISVPVNNLNNKEISPATPRVTASIKVQQPPIKTQFPVLKAVNKPTANNAVSAKKIKPTIKSSQSLERPNPNPQKKMVIPNSNIKPTIKAKPKAVMPSKNEY